LFEEQQSTKTATQQEDHEQTNEKTFEKARKEAAMVWRWWWCQGRVGIQGRIGIVRPS